MQKQLKKKILIAIPTAKYVECDTFKSIYDLEIPDGYETVLNFYHGYTISQIRNLIADWAIRYDYLFSVDSDITFPPDTLKRLIQHDKDIVSGVYRQRLPEPKIEIYGLDLKRLQYQDLERFKLNEIGGCGFGCVLIKSHVFETIGYPQFEYKSALDHRHTFSEDVDFCSKARAKGFQIFCDPEIVCGHIGTKIFEVERDSVDPTLARFQQLRETVSLPLEHVVALYKLKYAGFQPKVIFDIGSCVLHWYDVAKECWPEALIIPFEAMAEVRPLYQTAGIQNFMTGMVLTDQDHIQCEFYKNVFHPGGNSVFKENPNYSPLAEKIFPEQSKTIVEGITLDTIFLENNIAQPDLIKMDVQGSELRVLKGAEKVIAGCEYLILELQHVDYNMGAPKKDEVINYLRDRGFELVDEFGGSELGVDRDYLFKNTNLDRNKL